MKIGVKYMKLDKKKILIAGVALLVFIGGLISGFAIGYEKYYYNSISDKSKNEKNNNSDIIDEWISKEQETQNTKDTKEENNNITSNCKDNNVSSKNAEATYEQIINDIKNVYTAYYGSDFSKGLNNIENDKLIFRAVVANYKSGQTVNEEKIKNYVNRYFGPEHKYNNATIYCDIDKQPLFKFENGQYSFFNENNIHGHDSGKFYEAHRSNYIDVISYNENDNLITIKIKVLYGETCLATCGLEIHYSSNPSNSDTVLTTKFENDYNITAEEYNGIKGSIPVTTLTFTKNSDGTYFLSNATVQ